MLARAWRRVPGEQVTHDKPDRVYGHRRGVETPPPYNLTSHFTYYRIRDQLITSSFASEHFG